MTSDAQEANAISLEYDPARNHEYWERRPVAVVQRGVQIASAFGIWYLRGQLQRAPPPGRSLPSLQAERLRHILTHLGPAFVKIGQVHRSRALMQLPYFTVIWRRFNFFPDDCMQEHIIRNSQTQSALLLLAISLHDAEQCIPLSIWAGSVVAA